MNIRSISKEKQEAVVILTADDLVSICNALYHEDNKRNRQLYSDMMIAENICRYGHIDNFAIGQIVKQRNLETNIENK